MLLEALEVGEHLLDLTRPGHNVDRPHDRTNAEFRRRLAEDREQVLGEHQADDVVDGLLVHRIARPLRLFHQRERLVERRVHGERVDLGARRHHFARILLRKLEDPFDERGVGLLQRSALGALLDEHPQLLGGMEGLLAVRARLQAEYLEHELRGLGEQQVEWARDDLVTPV